MNASKVYDYLNGISVRFMERLDFTGSGKEYYYEHHGVRQGIIFVQVYDDGRAELETYWHSKPHISSYYWLAAIEGQNELDLAKRIFDNIDDTYRFEVLR